MSKQQGFDPMSLVKTGAEVINAPKANIKPVNNIATQDDSLDPMSLVKAGEQLIDKKKVDTGLSGKTSFTDGIFDKISSLFEETPEPASSKQAPKQTNILDSLAFLDAASYGTGKKVSPEVLAAKSKAGEYTISEEEKAKRKELDDYYKSEAFLPKEINPFANDVYGFNSIPKFLASGTFRLGQAVDGISLMLAKGLDDVKALGGQSAMALLTGSTKPFELDTHEKFKEAMNSLEGGDKVKFLGELSNAMGQAAGVLSRSAKRDIGFAEEDMDKGFSDFIQEGNVSKGIGAVFAGVLENAPQMALLAASGGTSAGVFAGATALGTGAGIASEYEADKNVSYGDAAISIGKGLVEGVTESIFKTDIDAARSLGKSILNLSPSKALESVKTLIKEEGADAAKNIIIRDAKGIASKMLGGSFEEGMEEILATIGEFVIDTARSGKWNEIDYERLTKQVVDSFVIGAASGGLMSGGAAYASYKPLSKEQKSTIDRYMEVVNNEELPQEVRDIAQKKADDILNYNADKYIQGYNEVAQLPVEKRIEAIKILNNIKSLESSKNDINDVEVVKGIDENISKKEEELNSLISNYTLDLADNVLSAPEALDGNVAFSPESQLTVFPERGYVFHFDSKEQIPQALRDIEPLTQGEVKGREKAVFRVAYTGQDLINAGLASQSAPISQEQVTENTKDVTATEEAIQQILDNTPDAISNITSSFTQEEGKPLSRTIAEAYQEAKANNTNQELVENVDTAIAESLSAPTMAAVPVVTTKPKRKRNVQTLRGMKPTEGVELSTNMVNDFTGVLGKLGRDTKQTLQNYVRALKSVRPEAKVFYYEDANAMEKGLRNSGYSAARAKQYAASSGGLFTTVNKGAEVVIHVNRQADLSKMGENAGRQSNIILAHEIVHATLLDLAKTNPSEFVTMKDSLLKMLARDESANEEIKEFAKRYSDRKVEVQAEEFLAQLGALITRQQATLKRSTLEKIKVAIREFLQKVASKFRSKALMDLVDSEVFSDTAKAEDTARFLEGLGKSLREGTDINMKYIKNLTKGSREYQQGLRYSILDTASPMPAEMDANTLMNNDMVVEPDDVKQSISEGNWLDNADNKKRLAKYVSNIKGMTEDDIWLAKAISYNEDKTIKLYTLKDKESVLAALENQLNKIEESLNNEITGQFEFARDGELWEKNGGYLFTGWKPAYITRKINYFSDPNTYNANELLRWNKIAEDQNYHKQEVGVIRDIQKKDLLANIKEFNGHNDFDPAFSYMLINSMIYNKYQIVENEETKEQEIVSFKYKQNQLAETDGTYNTIQYDVAKKLYDSEGSIQSTEELGMAYQKTFMSMGKMDVVNSKFNKYIDKKSSTGEGYWLKFEQGQNPEASYDLFEIAKTSHKYPAKWCTGNSDGMAQSQLLDGDFYVFVDSKTGDARIAVRYNGGQIAEVRGLGAGQAILPKDSGLVDEIVSTFKDGKSYGSYSKTLNDIKKIASGFFTKEEQEIFLKEYNPSISETRLDEFSSYIANEFSTDDILRIITERDRSYGQQDIYLQNVQNKLKSKISDIMEAKGEPRNTVVTDFYADETNTLSSATVKYILGDLNVQGGIHNFEELISIGGAIVIEGGGTQGKTKMIANKLQSVEQEIDIEYGDFESTSIDKIDNLIMRDYSSSLNLPNTTYIRRSTLRVRDNNIKLDSLEESQSINVKIEGINEALSLPKLKSTREISLDGRGDENYNLVNFNLNVPSLTKVYDQISLNKGLSSDYGSVNIFAPSKDISIREVINYGKQSLNLNVGSARIIKVLSNGVNSSVSINSQDSLSTSIGDLSVQESAEVSIFNVRNIIDITIRNGGVLNMGTPLDDVNNIYLFGDPKIQGETIKKIGTLTLAENGIPVEVSAEYIETVSIQEEGALRLLNNDRILTLLASRDSYADISSKKINRINATRYSILFANNLEEARIINLSNVDTFVAPQLFRVIEEISMSGYAQEIIKTPKLFEAGQVLIEDGGLEIDSLVNAGKIILKGGNFVSKSLNKVDEIRVEGKGLIKAKNLIGGYNLEVLPSNDLSESGNLTITDSNGTSKVQSEEPSDVKESRLGTIGDESREEHKRRTKTTGKQKLAKVYNKTFERNEEARLAFKKSDMDFSLYSMYLKAGASPFAMRKFADAYFKIYGGLNDNQIKQLDDVIYLMRVIAIDTNFDNRGKKRPAHPDFKDGKNYIPVNREFAEQFLKDAESDLGKEVIDDLKARAKEYFNTFSGILEYKYNNGLISKETYDLYKDYNYSPRKFLEHIIDVNGISQNSFINRGINLGADEIKNIQKGSTDFMLFDSANLLKAAMISAENRVFSNRALKFIFEEGATRKNDVVKDANYVKLKDGTIKLDKDGSPIVEEASDGFVNKTYRDNNGKTYTFQMRSDIAQQFDDLELSNSSSGIKKFFTFLLGANITRQMAVTLNPFFGLINPIIDLGTQVMFSNTYKSAGRGVIAQSIAATKEFASITKNMLASDFKGTKIGQKFGLSESASEGEIRQLIEEYGTYGGFMTTQSEVGTNANKLAKFLSYYGNVTEVSAKLSAYKFIKESMLKDFASNNIDPLTGESIQPTEEQMRNIMISAAYHARETLDYNRGGKWTKEMSSYIPFLNVSAQVKKVGGQYIVNNKADFIRKMADGIFVTAAITLANLIIGEDDYEKDPRIKIDRVDKTVILLPFTLKDLGLSDKEERAYIPLPTPSLAKQFFTIGQVMAEQIYYDSVGKVNPTEGSNLSKIIERNYKMFSKEIINMILPKTVQAGLSYNLNYDFWTGKKLTNDDKVVPSAQGIGNEDILSTLKFVLEGIDKLTDKEGVGFGGGFSMSPEKLQKSLEVVTTSARSNPIMNTAYWMIDNMFQSAHKIMTGEDVDKSIASKYTKETFFEAIGDTFGKGFGRLVRFSDPDKFDMPDFNAQNDVREELNLMDARLQTKKSVIYNQFLKIYDESKDQKNPSQYVIDKGTEFAKTIKDPRELQYAEGIGNFFYDKTKVTFKTNADVYYNIANVARDPRTKAYAIWQGFGDIRGNVDLQEDLKRIGVDKTVIREYEGLLLEKGILKEDGRGKPIYDEWYKSMLKTYESKEPAKPKVPSMNPPISNSPVTINSISPALVASTVNTSKEASNAISSIYNSIGDKLNDLEKTVYGKIELINNAIQSNDKYQDLKAVVKNPDLILAGIQRQFDKGDESGIVPTKIAVPKQVTPQFSLTGGKPIVASDTTNLGNLRNSKSEYLATSSITDLSKVNVGERNRGDYKEGQGNLVANFLSPFSSPENLNNNDMYVGIKNGKLVTGNGDKVKDAQSVTKTPFAQVVEITDELIKNQSYLFPKLKTLKEGQHSFLNISTTTEKKADANNRFAGGATIIETPDGSQKYLVRGSLNQVKSAFNDLKKNTNSPYLNMYILDNGSYSTGLFTKDGKSSQEELKSYESKNVNGGHGIYLK